MALMRSILLAMLPGLLLISIVVSSQNTGNCYWSGTAPFCLGLCPPNFHETKEHARGNGNPCWTGTKKHCCPSATLLDQEAVKKTVPSETCYWSGTAPFCSPSGCAEGYVSLTASRHGDGVACTTGIKHYCCPIRSPAAASSSTKQRSFGQHFKQANHHQP